MNRDVCIRSELTEARTIFVVVEYCAYTCSLSLSLCLFIYLSISRPLFISGSEMEESNKEA